MSKIFYFWKLSFFVTLITATIFLIVPIDVQAANEVLLSLSSGSSSQGSTVSLDLNIDSSQVLTDVTGVQWEFFYNPDDIASISIRDGGAAISANKTSSCEMISAGNYRCIAIGMNLDPILSGALSIVDVTIANSPATLSVPITLSDMIATDSNADSLGILGTGGTITLTDTTAPSVPTNLSTSTVSHNALTLSWTVSTDNDRVSGYKIFRNGVQIGTSPYAYYSDTGLSPSTSYSYTVSE